MIPPRILGGFGASFNLLRPGGVVNQMILLGALSKMPGH